MSGELVLPDTCDVATIDNDTTATQVVDALVTLKRLIKEKEKVRDAAQAPHKAAVAAHKKIGDQFRSEVKPLAEAERRLKDMLGAYELAQRTNKLALPEGLNEEEKEDAIEIAQAERHLEAPAVQFRRAVTFTVEDLSAVPAKYLKVDERAVKKALGLGRQIPGIRARKTLDVAVSIARGFERAEGVPGDSDGSAGDNEE